MRNIWAFQRWWAIPKKAISKTIRDKISKKIQGWRGMLLSKAGREVLIKAVAQSIPTYTMSVFKLPGNFSNELRSLVSSFWWGSEGGKRKIPWIAWDKLCEPKCKGGLGFRDYQKFNRALLGKQAWRLITNDDCLMSRVIGSKYFPNSSFLESNLGANPSYTWRGIWEAREVVKLGLRKRIGNGLNTFVWTDAWIPGTQSGMVLSPRGSAHVEMRVSDLIDAGRQKWVQSLFLPFEQDRILGIRLSPNKPDDSWCWDPEKDGNYSVKSAYKLLTENSTETDGPSDFARERWLWNKIWSAPVLPRIKLFFSGNYARKPWLRTLILLDALGAQKKHAQYGLRRRRRACT
ncbi:hypothetical protein RND81_14G190200 [Saponaria officinalis]|uniref:Uncharacterized protein n=1 Tax=Saponaria officinalis TaxID=3572 RepID=A0AAW1GPU6_SAPOF